MSDLERVNRLITGLKDGEPSVRLASAEALGRIGPEARKAVPALITVLKDVDSIVRYASAQALGTWARSPGRPCRLS